MQHFITWAFIGFLPKEVCQKIAKGFSDQEKKIYGIYFMAGWKDITTIKHSSGCIMPWRLGDNIKGKMKGSNYRSVHEENLFKCT